MKNYLCFLVITLISVSTVSSQGVGIGTSSPEASAILDVSSNNKGLMLPRLADTSHVINPAAGLMIYNRATQSPNFYNGIYWSNLSTAVDVKADSATYKIGAVEGDILSYNQSGARTVDDRGRPVNPVKVGVFSIIKKWDFNSNTLKSYLYQTPSTTRNIDIEFFRHGEETEYYKVSFQRAYLISITDFLNESGVLMESITFSAEEITFPGGININNNWP